jgi:signal recognition particle GTPase
VESFEFSNKVHSKLTSHDFKADIDVSQIKQLRPRVQSFEQLVLPQGHKDIVEALVKTHSRGDRPVRDAVGDEDNDHREDLVRGKGKGVILLLHGVPGVGKTSTAECVAEYTNRPLFALTCGKYVSLIS